MQRIFLVLMILLLLPVGVSTQVTGMWKVVDDKDGIEKSIMEITEVNGKYQGRVVKLLPASKRTYCEKCDGEMKDKPLTGMIILWDLKITANGGRDGKVLDPGSGKIFSCSIELDGPDRLKLRGYLGTPAVGKSSYWNRVK
jgi:uncharacterized protein (DUF2147 family)